MRRTGLTTLLWAAWLVFLATWAIRLTGNALAFIDTIDYVFPEKWVNVSAWRQGFVPLWNPTIACGMPHLANWQAASLYPPFWLWNLTGLWDWFYYVALLHGLWAALGFTFWLRSRGVHRVTAILVSFAYAGSSQMVQFWGFPTHLATLSWVPWVFLATDRFIGRPSWPRWAGLILCASMSIAAGYLHFTAYQFLFLALWIVFRRPEARTWMGLAAAGLFTLLLTAAHWLPALDFILNAYRPPLLVNVYHLRLLEYLPLFVPRILGIPNTELYRGMGPNFIFVPAYLGWASLVVLVAALVLFRKVRERFWLLSALGVLLWCMGSHFPPWRWVFGRLSGLLEPSKASFLWAFCACTAVATAFTQVWVYVQRRREWRWVAGFLAVLLLADIGTIPSRILRIMTDPYRDPKVVESSRWMSRMADEGRLGSIMYKNLRNDRTGLEAFLWEGVFQGFPNTNSVFGLRGVGGDLTIVVDGYQNILRYLQKGYPYEGRILDAAGVRLLVLPSRLSPIKYQVGMTYGRLLYQTNAGALPHAWRASRVQEFPDRPSVFCAMTDPDVFLEETLYTVNRPDGRAVMLDPVGRRLAGAGPPDPSWWDRVKGALKGSTTSRIHRKEGKPSPSHVLWEVDFNEKGWLVFSEAFQAGWHAWVDGKPTPIFLADGLFMGVPVPERGRHQVVFRYEPAAFRLGLFLSLAALGWFAGFAVLSMKGRP